MTTTMNPPARLSLRRAALALLATLGLAAATPALAQYPDRPVRIIVPYAPGGSVDTSIRMMAQQLSAQTGKQFVIENRAGGGGNIGVQAALEAPPDGYTLLAAGPNLSTAQWLSKSVEILHVPYKGGAPAITDTIGGQVQLVLVAASAQVPHIKGGRLRALGVTTANRYFDMPDTPSIGEVFPGYMSETWLGLAAHAGVPAAAVQYVSNEVRKALADPAVQKRYRDAGLTPQYKSSEELARYVAAELRTYERVIKEGNITAD